MSPRGWGSTKHPLHRGKGNGGRRAPELAAGNTAALVHGAKSVRVIDPVAASLVADAVAQVDYLAEPRYSATLEAWGRAEARVRILQAYLDEKGLIDGDEVRAAARFQVDCEKNAGRLRAELGLTPESAAKLGRNVSATEVNLTTIWAEMARRDIEQERTDGNPV